MKRSMDYGNVADKYDRRYSGISFEGIERMLMSVIGSSSAHRVLEVGCGTGHWLAFLESHGYKVSGMDPSPHMLKKAMDHVSSKDLKQGYAEEIPWEDDSFGQLFCVNAVHHFENKSRFVSEAFRVLRTDGGLLIVGLDPHKGCDQWFVYDYFDGTRDLDLRRYLPSQEIEKLMKEAGFSQCSTVEAHRLLMQIPARNAIEGGLLDKTIVSQLGTLDESDYDRGLQRVWKDIANSETRGEQTILVVDLLFYATMGWKHPQVL
jgi:ubiquinone/menaquinone biosynthesis C-methylase UbiE